MRDLASLTGWPALILSLFLAGACGTGGEGGDGGGGGEDDGGDGVAACAAADSFGEMGALVEVEAERHNVPGSMGNAKVYEIWAPLDDDDPGDYLQIELWDGFGAFSGGTVTTGTFEIAGPDTAVESCGACVFVLADVDGETGEPAQALLAQSGTLVVESGLPDLRGRIENVQLAQVDTETDELMADGCSASIDSAVYDASVICFGGGGGGSGGGGGGGGGDGEVPCE